MTDIIDVAQDYQQRANDVALANHNAKQLDATAGTEHCVGCGDPIPTARQRAVPGTQHCVECAA